MDKIRELVEDADRAVSALYDELQKTVPRFTSVDMSYLSLGCAFGGEKFAALYFIRKTLSTTSVMPTRFCVRFRIK